MPIGRHQVKSKSIVAYVLQCHPETKVYLPATEILDEVTFKHMVQKYEKVYLKPDQGRKSRGIVRMEKVQEGLYLELISKSEIMHHNEYYGSQQQA
jgi:hypothetical protein